MHRALGEQTNTGKVKRFRLKFAIFFIYLAGSLKTVIAI